MLEQQLGVPLFHRTTRSVRMTNAGTILLNDVRGILSRLENVVTELRAEEALQRGRLVIVCTPSCASNLLPDLLREYHSRNPNISLEVKEAYAGGMYDYLQRDEADIAIGLIDRDKDDFNARKLRDDPYGVIMSIDYHLAGKKYDRIAGNRRRAASGLATGIGHIPIDAGDVRRTRVDVATEIRTDPPPIPVWIGCRGTRRYRYAVKRGADGCHRPVSHCRIDRTAAVARTRADHGQGKRAISSRRGIRRTCRHTLGEVEPVTRSRRIRSNRNHGTVTHGV